MSEIGRQIGNYIIEELLQDGHCRGRHATTGRRAHLRRLPLEPAQLQEELAILQQLRPAGLEEVCGIEEEEDGLWLITGQMEGRTLAESLRVGPLDISTAAALGAGLLPGLAQLHAHRLVHRDIQPDRICLTAQGPRLTGAAMALLEGQSIRYMAPELWSRKPPSPASDVYALGVTLYESLTGSHPFPRDLPRAAYARLHRRQGIPRVRARRPEVPQWLDDAIWQATRPSLRERFADAGQMLQAIQRAQRSTAPAPPPRDAPPPARSTSLLTGCLALAALGAVALLLGGGLWLRARPGGIRAALHSGPVLLITNPTDQKVTFSCTSGASAVRTGAILDPGEEQALLLDGAPAKCMGFTADQQVLLKWAADALPAAGQPWRISLASPDTASEEAAEDAEDAEDSGLTFAEGIVEMSDERPAPRPRRRSKPAAEPVTEPAKAELSVAVSSRRKRNTKDVHIYINGLYMGYAPTSSALAPGEHTVRWLKDDRVDLSCTVTLPASGLTVSIDPAEPACP